MPQARDATRHLPSIPIATLIANVEACKQEDITSNLYYDWLIEIATTGVSRSSPKIVTASWGE